MSRTSSWSCKQHLYNKQVIKENDDEVREFDVALSFAGEDRTYVDQVANLLRYSGTKVFYDRFQESDLWGKNLYDYLSEIYMSKAEYTVMFISKHYAEKRWPDHERQAMQARAFKESREYILPARFDETSIPGVHSTIHYISLDGRDPESLVEITHQKLINRGYTVPSESIRKSLFSAATVPRVDPKSPVVMVKNSAGEPLTGVSVVAIADNNTTRSGKTMENGEAQLTIPTRRQYQLLVAHPDYPGAIIHKWDPGEGIEVTLTKTENMGSVICKGTGYIPGLEGRLSPILDSANRTYLYARNIAINGGENQPVTFEVNEPFELEDSNGVVMQVQVLHIQGRTSLIRYCAPKFG